MCRWRGTKEGGSAMQSLLRVAYGSIEGHAHWNHFVISTPDAQSNASSFNCMVWTLVAIVSTSSLTQSNFHSISALRASSFASISSSFFCVASREGSCHDDDACSCHDDDASLVSLPLRHVSFLVFQVGGSDLATSGGKDATSSCSAVSSFKSPQNLHRKSPPAFFLDLALCCQHLGSPSAREHALHQGMPSRPWGQYGTSGCSSSSADFWGWSAMKQQWSICLPLKTNARVSLAFKPIRLRIKQSLYVCIYIYLLLRPGGNAAEFRLKMGNLCSCWSRDHRPLRPLPKAPPPELGPPPGLAAAWLGPPPPDIGPPLRPVPKKAPPELGPPPPPPLFLPLISGSQSSWEPYGPDAPGHPLVSPAPPPSPAAAAAPAEHFAMAQPFTSGLYPSEM